MRLLLTHQAYADLTGIAEQISDAAEDDQVALQLVSALHAQCEKLATLPGRLGRPRPDLGPELRSFPYRSRMIIFRYEKEALVVARILHGRQHIPALFDDDER